MTQHQTHIAKEYETIYILRPDVDADAADKVQGRVAEVITREQGTMVKVEAWGRRKLAYPVKKQKKGVYVYVKYVGKGGLVSELERNLKLADAVMKFQTVLVRDEVLIADVAVDPEEVKFERLELAADEDDGDSLERSLGLVDAPHEPRRDRHEDEFADDEFGDDKDKDKKEAAPEAPEAN